MISGEITVLRPNVLELTSGRINDLHIAGNVFISVKFAKFGERLISYF